ncbi:MAG: DUF262 domain-containing protein [Chloroflexota bacterium]|nr:DUF262 domain-containing protein [Chloroflexota bacterium]
MNERLKVTPGNEDLFSLVKEAASGKLALPQFQRSFVWTAGDIRELLVSVFNGYFIGSLLLLDIDSREPPFLTRSVEGSHHTESELEGAASRLLLDGQQRITSLHYAFAAPDIPLKGRSKQPTVFFIDLKQFFDGDVDDAIFYKSKSRCRVQELEPGQWQFENLIVPLSQVSDLEQWSDWKSKYSNWLLSQDVDQFKNWLQTIEGGWQAELSRVWQFRQPVLSLSRIEPDNTRQLEEICTIFEKLNSTGITLSVFDLLTARLYPQGIKLDELWNDALEQCEFLRKFDAEKSDFGVFLLRMIALKRGDEIKGKALIRLSVDDFNEDWNEAVHYLNEGFKRLTSLQDDGFGVFNPKWLPSKTTIPLLGALLAKRDLLPAERRASATKVIQWWYWGSTFIARYSGPTETISQRDFVSLSRYMESEDNAYPEVFSEVYDELLRHEEEFSILSVERASNIVYKAVMCLLALNDAKDFRNYESITFSQLDDHHIFPKAYLQASSPGHLFGLTATGTQNTIVNRTLISSQTNRAIGKRAPSEYLHDESIIHSGDAQDILARHFIDDTAQRFLRQDNYPKFLQQRERAILGEIRSIFGDMPTPPTYNGL